MIDQIDNIVAVLRKHDSKNPMPADVFATKLAMHPKRFEEVMDIICNIVPAPVNRAYKEVTENAEKGIKAFKGFVYWPTGVVDKAHWKDFKPASSKPAGQPVRTELSTKKVSADTYETPVFGQPASADEAVAQIEKIIDAPKQKPLISPVADYSHKPKVYQFLKYIEANPASTTKFLSDEFITTDFGNYFKPYIKSGLVVRGKNEHGKRTWSLKEGWTADQVYETRKGGSNYIQQPGEAQHEATPIPQQPQETTATGALDAQAQAAEPIRVEVPEVQAKQSHQAEVLLDRPSETHQPEVANYHPVVAEKSRYRYAYTNDGCLMLIEECRLPLELNREETRQLLSFLNDQLCLLEAGY